MDFKTATPSINPFGKSVCNAAFGTGTVVFFVSLFVPFVTNQADALFVGAI